MAELDKLRSHPFLRSLPSEEVKAISSKFTSGEFKQGDVVFRQGAQDDKLYLIITGRVRFTFTHLNGVEDEYISRGDGSFFGEVAAFSMDGIRTANAIVAEELSSFYITGRDLKGYLKSHPESHAGDGAEHEYLWSTTGEFTYPECQR